LIPTLSARELFGERMSSAIVSTVPEQEEPIKQLLDAHQVPYLFLSPIGGDYLTIGGPENNFDRDHDLGEVSVAISDLRDAYEGAIPRAMGGK
jgi:hypothetical protein